VRIVLFLFYIFAPESKQEQIGHRNSRQAESAFSSKADTPLCEGEGLQRYGFSPDYHASKQKV
jgi:hypothetical protein